MPATNQTATVFELAAVSLVSEELTTCFCARSGRLLGTLPQNDLIRITRIHGRRAESVLRSATYIAPEWQLIDEAALEALRRETPIEFAVFSFATLARLEENYENTQLRKTLHKHLTNLAPSSSELRLLNIYLQRMHVLHKPLLKFAAMPFPTEGSIRELIQLLHKWYQAIMVECKKFNINPLTGIAPCKKSHPPVRPIPRDAIKHVRLAPDAPPQDALQSKIRKLSIREIAAAETARFRQKPSGIGLNKLLAAQLNKGARK